MPTFATNEVLAEQRKTDWNYKPDFSGLSLKHISGDINPYDILDGKKQVDLLDCDVRLSKLDVEYMPLPEVKIMHDCDPELVCLVDEFIDIYKMRGHYQPTDDGWIY